jgi:hypothetical protein
VIVRERGIQSSQSSSRKAVWETGSLARPNELRGAPGSELERAGRSRRRRRWQQTTDVEEAAAQVPPLVFYMRALLSAMDAVRCAGCADAGAGAGVLLSRPTPGLFRAPRRG